MKFLQAKNENGVLVVHPYELSDECPIFQIDAAGTDKLTAANVPGGVAKLAIVMCKRIDASNYCLDLPSGFVGQLVEIYADGNVTVFPYQYPSFFDGTASVAVSGGSAMRFRAVPADNVFGIAWAHVG